MSSYPSSSQFLVELKTVTEWYLLGVHLGVPTQDLDDIDTRFGSSKGAKVCLAKVYEKYKDQHGSPSWEVILEALKAIDKITLADDISKRYLSQESGSTQSISGSESDGSVADGVDGLDCDTSHVFINDEVKDKFDTLSSKYSKVVLSVKNALKAKNVDDLQSIIQNRCHLQPLPPESATLHNVFQRIQQNISCYDVSLLLIVAENIVKPVVRKVKQYCEELNEFKSSTLMKKIVEDVKKKRCGLPPSTKLVTLKVSEAWHNATIRDFERLVKIVLHEEQLSKIQVTEGCMCITWIAPDVEVDKIVDCNMVYNKHFMDAIAVLSLSIGDVEIYRRQDQSDTPVSLDSAMLQAIEKGVIDAVELLLAVGANPYLSLPSGDAAISAIVNMRGKRGWTVLHSAYRHADVTSLLLCEGCDPNVVDNAYDGRTPIMVASKYGYCDTVGTLIGAGADVNKVGHSIGTPLTAAAESGHDNIVATLIGAGADVNKADSIGTTPFIIAARAGHDNTVATLIDAGADVNEAGRYTGTPLLPAAKAGHDNIVATLISAGADVNKADDDGTTPLLAAAKAGHDNVVAILIGAGADVNKADHTGTTPLKLLAAAWAGHDNVITAMSIIAACLTGNNHLLQQLLLHPNINIDQEVYGDTLLVAAIKHNHPSIVTTLLLYGADPNVPTSNGTMALMMACERGNKEIVQSLLQHNANVDYQDESTGNTPLMVAIQFKYVEIVQLLFEWGANLHEAANVAKTHARQGNFDIAATILERHTMVSSDKYQQLVPPSSDGQSSQSSLDGHCNTKHSGISYLTYGDILHTTASDTQRGRQSIGRRSIRSGGSTHSSGSNMSR